MIAGGPYYCAQANEAIALSQCMQLGGLVRCLRCISSNNDPLVDQHPILGWNHEEYCVIWIRSTGSQHEVCSCLGLLRFE